MAIEPLRHLSVFSPTAWGTRKIDVIGAGATGSIIVDLLVRLGIEAPIHVWDFDKVETHNLANQIYGVDDIGKLKVEALAAHIKQQTGVDIVPHAEKVDGTQPLGPFVFLLTDTMASRREIWQRGIKYKVGVQQMIETRMGTDVMRVYAINPVVPSHIKCWEETLSTDDIAEVSACGASTSVGPTAKVLSGVAAWYLMRWFAIQQGKQDDTLENELILGLRPPTILSRVFK